MLTLDPFFPISLGESLTQSPSAESASLVLSSFPSLLASCRHLVLNLTEPSPLARYYSLQATLASRIRRGAPHLRIAFIAAWTGSREPSPAFSRSIAQFSALEQGASVVFIDALAAPASYFADTPNVHVHRIANLSFYIHTSVDVLLPALKTHPRRWHYPLGRKLSDFRWMFGAIFKDYLSKFTHWAWVDAHDFAGDLFGPITQYGADFARFDIVSFTSIDGTVKNDPHVSGYLAVLHNTIRGRELFRRCDSLVPQLLETDMVGGGTDEVHCSDDLLRSPGVTVALIEAAWRYPDSVYHNSEGIRHLVYAPGLDASRAQLDRIPAPPPAHFSSLDSITFYSYKRRSKGPLPVSPFVLPANTPAWFVQPRESPSDHPDGKHVRGFGTLLRDHLGRWWLRPMPPEVLVRFANGTLALFDLPLLHSRPPPAHLVPGKVDALWARLGVGPPVAALPPSKRFAMCC